MIKTTAEAITLAVIGVSGSGTSAIGLAALTNESAITAETWMPLGLFVTCILTTATVVWKVSEHKTKINSKLDELERDIQELKKDK